MPYKLKKVKGGWQVTSPGHPQGFKKNPHKNKGDAIDQMAAIKISAKESISLIKSMLQEAEISGNDIGLLANDRLAHLSDLLSQVETGKLSAVVAADMAGLIDPSEDSLGEDASIARLKWEIESLEGSLQEASEKYTFEVKWTDREYRDQKKAFSDTDKETARKKANTFADKLEKDDSKDKYGNIRGRVKVAMKESNALDKKTPTEEELAAKYGVDISTVREALKVGTGVEFEHTNDPEIAKEIALDHLGEKLNYYDKLED